MGFIQNVKRWIMNLFNIVQKVAPETLPLQSYYDSYIQLWKQKYQSEIKKSTFENALGQVRERNLKTLQLYELVASEFASLTFTEKVKVEIVNENDEKIDIYDEYVNEVFTDNDFHSKKLDNLERMFALGGSIEKIYRNNGKTVINYINADSFIPTAWENDTITDCIFVTKTAKDKYIYVLIEKHTFAQGEFVNPENDLVYDSKVRIEYKLYRCEEHSQNEGVEIPVSTLYKDRKDSTIYGVSRPLFSYCKPSRANNIEFDSPLGVSIYHDCIDLIDVIDRNLDFWDREFALGKKRVYVPSSALKQRSDGLGGNMQYFDPDDDTFVKLNLDDEKIESDTQVLRVDDIVNSINALLNLLCLKLRLSQGAISFDAKSGLKTATEVISENSKTFRTKQKHEVNIERNITEIVESIVDVALLYQELPLQEYKVKVIFDDSIIIDKEAERVKDMSLVTMGLLSKISFLMKHKGMTREQAQEEIAAVRSEQGNFLEEE